MSDLNHLSAQELQILQHTLDLVSKSEFRRFIPRVFSQLNPSETLKWNWHMDYMAWMLARCMPDHHQPQQQGN